ncbi:MAG: glycoside hydrolase, partial [Actinomycetota bacterium]|nr:glycoside hydrolase [Actinomycetota bacterium]
MLLAASCGSEEGEGAARPAPNVWVNAKDKVQPLSRNHEAPAVLIDRDEPNTVYLAESEMISGECRFYVSTDRGASWQPEEAPKLEPFTRNCAMGYASSQNIRTELQQGRDGTIYLVFQANDPGRNGTRSVLLGRSKDGGRSWQTVAIDPGKPAPEPGIDMEANFEGHLALDSENPRRVYAIWRRSFNNRFRTDNPPTRPYMSISDDAGATWSTPFVPFEKNIGFDGPRPIAVDGRLWAFYREAAPSAQPDQPPPLTRLFAGVSGDQGKTWEHNEITAAADASEVYPLYDRDKKLFHVVWHDNRAAELDAYYSRSTDGKTWTQPKRLNDDPTGMRMGQHYPQISQAPNGRIDVAWYDWRDDPFPPPTPPTSGSPPTSALLGLFSNRGKVASVYMTSSQDDGRSWTRNVRVNDVPIDRTIGSWINNKDVMAPVAISSGDRGPIIAWSDTRNGNGLNDTQDIFTSTVTFGDPADRQVTPLQAG